jgi:hypothetical protein
VYWTGQPLTRDEHEYLSLARSLAHGDGFRFDDQLLAGPIEPFGRAPGYPLFLALVGGGTSVTTQAPVAVQVAQSVLAAAGIVLAALVAGRVAGLRGARAAAALTAIYPPLVWSSAYVFSEALFWPIGLLTIWAIDRIGPRRLLTAAIGCGVLIGVGILIRPALVLIVPAAVGWFAFRRAWRPVAGLLVGVALLVGPWTVRNYSHYGRFVLVATEGGVTFWTGNNPLARGEGDMAANPEIKRASQELRARHPGLDEAAMEPVYYREALRWMRDHPRDWLALEMRKVFYTIVPVGPSYWLHSNRYIAASLLSYGTILTLAVVGLVRGHARWQMTPGTWLMAASACAVCLIFFPQERFRLPVLDPVLILIASGTWATRHTEARQ